MSLKNSQSHFKAEAMANEAARLYVEEGSSPFPYDDCFWLRQEFESKADDLLIPYLDLWFLDIAGFCSWGKRILNWSESKVVQARSKVSLGFFEQHPQYAILERFITKDNTPDLFGQLLLFETMRHQLIRLFDFMLTEKLYEQSSAT